ncbi:phage head-tail connector protein [Brevundimonas vitis]|uniref:Phage head-tail connector protein n=1 Tax=Brevundimonas vitisensis TaxID=2800818 RepID=A0ABX7BWE4_9CAUL|nr:head-tail connector protein [Brevundimonas vitisensis]QQQ19830.1 phage head-tail connector protein [Brevundimonas vitisensis]
MAILPMGRWPKMNGRVMHGSYAPVRTSAPSATPVSVAEAKAHLRVDHSDDDTLIGLLINAATSELDGWTGILGRALVTQSWSQTFDGFESRLRLPLPAATVASVAYVAADGDTQTMDGADYVLRHDALGSFVETSFDVSWPSTRAQSGAVTVTFTAGTAAADVPGALKAALLLRVGDLYANREAGVDGSAIAINPTIHVLIAPFRRVGV